MHLRKYGSPSSPLRVAAVQMESKVGDKEANFAKIEAFVKQAAQQGVQLCLFSLNAVSAVTGSSAISPGRNWKTWPNRPLTAQAPNG